MDRIRIHPDPLHLGGSRSDLLHKTMKLIRVAHKKSTKIVRIDKLINLKINIFFFNIREY